MKEKYKSRLIIGLLTLNILFLLIFTLAFINSVNGRATINTGLSANFENLIIMVFSVISVINVLHELWKVE